MLTTLFRLWVVGTVLWVGLLLFVSTYDSRPHAFVTYLQGALIPPSVIFIIGIMVAWAFGGFAKRK